MNTTTNIYSDDSIIVAFDAVDSIYPISITTDDPEENWLTAAEAIEIADAIYDALKRTPIQARVVSDNLNESIMRLAEQHGRTVKFSYAKGNGKTIEVRRLQPQDIREVGSHMTVTGYDPDRDDVRAYRLDRVKGEVTIT